MTRTLQIVHVEDDSSDVQMIRRVLAGAGIQCNLRVVQSRREFEHELAAEDVDLILSDFSLPTYDGLSALAAAKAQRPEIPFIFVSGRIGEEAAVESLKNGASDYLVKDRLGRLPAAIQRAVNEAEERKKRREAEAALFEREEMFAAFMNFSPGPAFLKRADGSLLYANERLKEWFHCHGRDWRSHGSCDFLPSSCAAAIREHDLQVLESGQPLQSTEMVPESDGTLRHWFVSRFALQRQSGERLVGGIALDVTSQKELERKFLRAQRLESLGILAGGLAHDLNNVLLPVLLGCEVLRESVSAESDREVLSMMEASASRGSSLIRQMLMFARGSNEQRLLIRPAHLLKDLADIATRTFPANIAIRCDVAHDLAAIEADPTQIHQVLLNLIVNARDAMPGGGELQMRARNVDAAEVTDHFGGRAEPGEYVLIEISDTGAGIPEPLRERIFEPFFTTKEAGKGTGLGLSTSVGIVKSHLGFIDFRTEAGQGTLFSVSLPAVRSPATSEASRIPRRDLGGGAEVVLIVDDEAAAREVTKSILGRHAYQVLTAANGAEALSVFARFKDRVHVVLIDYKMPLMDGPQTVREIRKMSPTVKIAGMSGHAIQAISDEFTAAGADAFLPKPFTAEQILATLSRLLGAANSV